MPVFRRSSAGATDSTAQGSSQRTQSQEAPAKNKPPAEAGKGRPTPKRSEAEASRYQSVTGSTTSGRGPSTGSAPRGKLTPEEKAKARSERDKRLHAMRRGEEWALGPRDRGPIKKLARDYVDAHRRPSEFYMYALIVLLVALLSRSKVAEHAHVYCRSSWCDHRGHRVDAYFMRRALFKLAAERLPERVHPRHDDSTRSCARCRSAASARPAPRLKPGDEF